MKRFRGMFFVFMMVALLALGSLGAAAMETITIADWNFLSARANTRIAAFIVEHGYGYDVEYRFSGSTPALMTGMARGDIDLSIETWVDNMAAWPEFVETGTLINLGRSYDGAPQGLYVPTYVIEGDPSRGIEPMAPDLHSVKDLPQYWKLFRDPENPSQGRIYSAPLGWEAYTIGQQKIKAYGLDPYYTSFSSGSETALNASLVSAYKQGEPWLGYNYEPTWVLGELDMTRLQEPPYTEECWSKREKWQIGDGCAFPPARVLVVASSDFYQNGPDELITFFKKFHTTLQATEKALAYMHDNGLKSEAASLWFLRNYRDVWTDWVPAPVADKVQAALKEA